MPPWTWPGCRAAWATSWTTRPSWSTNTTSMRPRPASRGRGATSPRRLRAGSAGASGPPWSQAGRPGQDGHLLRGRRRVYLRRAHRGPLRGARLQPARALRRLQQSHLERGQARRAVPRAGWLGGEDGLHAPHRARAGPRLRDGVSRLGRPRRAGRGSRPALRRPRARAAHRQGREAPGPPQRHLQEAVMKILATGPSGTPEELQPLRDAGHEIVVGRPLDQPGRVAYTEADLREAARDVDVILASHLETISGGVLEAAPRLRLVIVPFIGTDKIDLGAATRLGVLVANSPTPENFIAVAEATVGLMLMLLKRIKHNEVKLRRGEWAQREDRGDFLFGKTVGLVGLGRVGSHVARRLVNWDVRLLASDPYVPAAHAQALGATLVDLPALLAESDVVSLHASLTDETRHLIGEKALRAMKPTAILVNTARGEIADEEAIARALTEGWIAGAALDAFTREPLPAASPLRDVDPERLILTPHNVSHSEAGRRANLALALDQILAAGRGEPPAHCVNPEAIPRWRTS